MVGHILAGAWASLVLVATAYAATEFKLLPGTAGKTSKPVEKYDSITTGMISVPVIGEAIVQGYVLAKFSVTARADVAGKVSSRLQDLITDEAYRVIYNSTSADFRKAQKSDLTTLTNAIGVGINKRAGVDAVKDVLIKEFSFISKEDARK